MINMDFAQRVVINTNNLDWLASPMAGVWRKPLAREEAERGHATSIVRYDAGAKFREHDHPLGEEILVLSGTFSDHTGDYKAGTYFRNPPGFKHAPYSHEGCVILVKLHQFQSDDSAHVVINTEKEEFTTVTNDVKMLALHDFNNESVAMQSVLGGVQVLHQASVGGEEIFVIRGELIDEHGRYPAGTWLRSPQHVQFELGAEIETLIWVKSGHLTQ